MSDNDDGCLKASNVVEVFDVKALAMTLVCLVWSVAYFFLLLLLLHSWFYCVCSHKANTYTFTLMHMHTPSQYNPKHNCDCISICFLSVCGTFSSCYVRMFERMHVYMCVCVCFCSFVLWDYENDCVSDTHLNTTNCKV